MRLVPDLSTRDLRPELMDDPDLDERRHREALRGLARINAWSLSARTIWSAIRPLARRLSDSRLQVLDVATGAGDIPIVLWDLARREGIDLIIDGCDISRLAIAFAQERAAAMNAPVRFSVKDVLNDGLGAECDVAICSLFLHHLKDDQAVALISNMARAARRTLLISDLMRCRMGYLVARLGTRILTRSEVVRWDGPRSVEAAFTIAEVRGLAQRAGIESYTITPTWPFRFLLEWRRA